MTAYRHESAAEGGQSDDRTGSGTAGQGTSRWRRIGTAAVGVGLVAWGAKRRSLGGLVAVLVGGYVTYRAVRSGSGRDGAEHDPHGPADREAHVSGQAINGQGVSRSITVGKPPTEVVASLRNPDTLDRILGDAIDVSVAEADDRYEWTWHGPLGRELRWETQLVEDESGLRWETVNGARVSLDAAATVRPAPARQGTELTLRLTIDPPGGTVGDAVADRFGAVPASLAGAALDRFKSLAEAGEIPTLEGNPSARGTGDRV